MTAALMHLDPKQKARLARRAKKRGRSFTREVCNAIDLYLDVPLQNEEEFEALAREAKGSAGRSIKRLDETIAYVERGLKAMRRSR